MQILELSEATAARRRIPIMMVDVTDGITAETGLTVVVVISKNGAGFGAGGGSVTEDGNGVYYYEASAGDLDTVGYLALKATNAGARTFMGIAQVVSFDPYDAFTARLPALVGGRVDASVGAMAADVITAAATAADFGTEIKNAVLAGVVDGTRTVKGCLARLNALARGKWTGLNGPTATGYLEDGVTKAMEFAVDAEAGTRDAATTTGGD